MAYVDQYLKLDIASIVSLNNGKYKFKSTELEGTTLIKEDNYIDIDSWYIGIETQKTNYGIKQFFRCPYCLKNRQYLYHINGSWKCRECGNLKYMSTTTYRNGMDYCDLKIDKILDKLKVEHKIEYYTGDLLPYVKPYKMRWTTYTRLIRELKYWQCERAERWLKYVSLRINK
ncbi:hypothetical protein PMY38_07715 [Clostridium tertium]|jgi:ribosomal protein L37AE/L43A|uniref:hypothetical protein n=1 Tax=Clostridium tertium TaxID=1559 RepID=UPI00232E823B|nr:hypothetical protein [Clostridium tertium]MDB1956608.1 hypothetical protein [Clostridium tertium]MDB1958479.1 hypothetical protein [Clostridium tertium]MDB1962370.1 hypothetical protein [Clostridium tertium]MDB1967660.1 hypothetical protein [Clostridium tertium]